MNEFAAPSAIELRRMRSARQPSTERWQLCSAVLTEGRRLRALAADIRTRSRDLDLTRTGRAALDDLVAALETAAARGDVAADLILRQPD